jgi:hypothetical protein
MFFKNPGGEGGRAGVVAAPVCVLFRDMSGTAHEQT